MTRKKRIAVYLVAGTLTVLVTAFAIQPVCVDYFSGPNIGKGGCKPFIIHYFGKAKSFEEWLSLAEDGDKEAQGRVASMYLMGGRPFKLEQIPEWLKEAAVKGQPDSMRLLARAYENGWGTPKDYQASFDWYAKAAAEGEAQAYWEGNIVWYKHREVKGGPIPINENLYGKEFWYTPPHYGKSLRGHVDGRFSIPRKCVKDDNLGLNICNSDVDEVLPYLNDKLRYISKFSVCFPDGIERERIYEAVRVQSARIKNQRPKPPSDPRKAFFWEELVGPRDHGIAEALSRAFPCK